MRSLVWLLFAIASLFGQQPNEAHVSFLGKDIIYLYGNHEDASEPAPLLVFLRGDVGADLGAAKKFWEYWRPFAAERGWRLIVPWTKSAAPAWTDTGVEALEAIVQDAQKRFPADANRLYLAGYGDGASEVFYILSRKPDLWAAGLAIEGSPKIAIDTNRLYGVNTSLAPLLWALRPAEQEAMDPYRQKLNIQGYNVTVQATAQFTVKEAFDWLSKHTRQTFPSKVDCETGSALFGRCYWVEMVKFDPSLRNDALGSTRVQPGAGAFLDLGGFGFSPTDSGPGILVGWLPDDYRGPLKIGDRVVSVGGRTIRDAQDYLQRMDQVAEEKAVGILLERGGKRQRLETRIVLPKRDEIITARVQAQFLPEFDEVQVLSRGVAQMRLQIPPQWTPCKLTWNGTDVRHLRDAGCVILTAGASSQPCGP
jgi:hypothetical protein